MNKALWIHTLGENLIIPEADIQKQESIGKGGFGEVWRGKWNGQGGGAEVAIKVMEVEITPSMLTHTGELDRKMEEQLLESFSEVKVMGKMRHLNVVALNGVCVVPSKTSKGGQIWIVMEYVEGGSLYTYLQSSKELTWPMRWSLALQAARGVNVLHKSNPQIIHRYSNSMMIISIMY